MPKIVADGTGGVDYRVMGVVEYLTTTEYGFVRYRLNSNFETHEPSKAQIKKFNDRLLKFTSTYCPDAEKWYGMAIDAPNNENILIFFDWEDLVDKAKVWVLSSHD